MPPDTQVIIDVTCIDVELQCFVEREGKSIDLFEREVAERIRTWCAERHERVARCVVFLPTDTLHMMVGVPGPYDFELGEDISALELGFVDAGWPSITVMQFCSDNAEELRKFGTLAAKHAQTDD
jgi:hypothetical protein